MARGGCVRAEGGADVGVVQVVSVPQDDRGTFRRRQTVGEVLELRERRTALIARDVRKLRGRARASVLVDDDPARDRERPGAKVLRVAELRVRAQRTEEGLLKRVVGVLAPEPADEERIDLVPVLLVETLEGRHRHVDIL